MNVDAKTLKKFNRRIQQCIYKKWMPWISGICPRFARLIKHLKINYCNTLYQQAKKKKKHIIVSIDAGKAFGKIQNTFMVKTLSEPGKEGNYLNFIEFLQNKNYSLYYT